MSIWKLYINQREKSIQSKFDTDANFIY